MLMPICHSGTGLARQALLAQVPVHETCTGSLVNHRVLACIVYTSRCLPACHRGHLLHGHTTEEGAAASNVSASCATSQADCLHSTGKVDTVRFTQKHCTQTGGPGAAMPLHQQCNTKLLVELRVSCHDGGGSQVCQRPGQSSHRRPHG